jgi:hypothetical protein
MPNLDFQRIKHTIQKQLQLQLQLQQHCNPQSLRVPLETCMSLPAPTATGSTAVPVPHVARIKQEPSSHKQEPTPWGMRPAPRRVSDQGLAPHHHKIVAAAAPPPPPRAKQSGPPSTTRVSDQGYAPTIKREYPARPRTMAQIPKQVAHVTTNANRAVGSSVTASTDSHQKGHSSSNHYASGAFPTHDKNVPGTSSSVANANSSRPAARPPLATQACNKSHTNATTDAITRALSKFSLWWWHQQPAAAMMSQHWLAQVHQVAANRWRSTTWIPTTTTTREVVSRNQTTSIRTPIVVKR